MIEVFVLNEITSPNLAIFFECTSGYADANEKLKIGSGKLGDGTSRVANVGAIHESPEKAKITYKISHHPHVFL